MRGHVGNRIVADHVTDVWNIREKQVSNGGASFGRELPSASKRGRPPSQERKKTAWRKRGRLGYRAGGKKPRYRNVAGRGLGRGPEGATQCASHNFTDGHFGRERG